MQKAAAPNMFGHFPEHVGGDVATIVSRNAMEGHVTAASQEVEPVHGLRRARLADVPRVGALGMVPSMTGSRAGGAVVARWGRGPCGRCGNGQMVPGPVQRRLALRWRELR
jgi:hypothetical protein